MVHTQEYFFVALTLIQNSKKNIRVKWWWHYLRHCTLLSASNVYSKICGVVFRLTSQQKHCLFTKQYVTVTGFVTNRTEFFVRYSAIAVLVRVDYSLVNNLLQLSVLQVVSDHHLEHLKQLAVRYVAVAIDVVDFKRNCNTTQNTHRMSRKRQSK